MLSGPKFGPKVTAENQRGLALNPKSAAVQAAVDRDLEIFWSQGGCGRVQGLTAYLPFGLSAVGPDVENQVFVRRLDRRSATRRLRDNAPNPLATFSGARSCVRNRS